MKQVKTCVFVAFAVLCTIIAAPGCTEHTGENIRTEVKPHHQKPAAELALKFEPSDRTTYKLTTENKRGVLWEGPQNSRPKEFIGGHSGNKIQMTFERRILSVNDEGNAIARITVKDLKYTSEVKNEVVLDFDSSREKDQQNPLYKLTGQSYTIELTPSGRVSRVIDVNDARDAVAGGTRNHARATGLLSPSVITDRHSIPPLPAAGNQQLRPGRQWTNIKTFSFGPMGAESFERIFEITQINDNNGRTIVVADMKAVPSTARAKELYEEKSGGFFSSMFDNTETYTGRLKLDATSGKIEQYTEQFRSDWVAVDPMAKQQTEQPDMLRMSAVRYHGIERVH
jgi:hypothetical protein